MVRFLGRPIVDFPVRALRQRVGFVFQTPAMFPGTVADNLAVVATLGGEATAAGVSERIAEVLRQMELGADFWDRIAADLSSEEKQRVALAGALMAGPEVLLLDEPTAALDPEVAEHLMYTLRRLHESTGLTIVMVTHPTNRSALCQHPTPCCSRPAAWWRPDPSARLFSAPLEARTRKFITAGEEGKNHG